MDGEERRSALLRIIQGSEAPVSAGRLAAKLGVSRQIIVGDVALLRAAGFEIAATPRGYLLPPSPDSGNGIRRRIACRHRREQMKEELCAIVDQGCQVLDVIVEHPVYGELTGSLCLSSRYDIEQFDAKCSAEGASPLSLLTEGIHLHTIQCPDEAAFERVCRVLREMGILLSSAQDMKDAPSNP